MKTLIAAVVALGLATPAFADGNVWDVLTGKKKNDPQTPAQTQPQPPAGQPRGNRDIFTGRNLPTGQGVASNNADLAKKDVDVGGINIQAAKLYVTGLYDLSSRANMYDRGHGTDLFNKAQDAITDAEKELADLAPMAQGAWAKAADPLARVRSTLVNAQGHLRALAGAINANGNDVNRIRDLYKELDGAERDLNDAAKAMNVDTRLNTP